MRDSSPALELRGVSRSYGSVDAVRSLDLTVAHGELLSLIGPSGCGKTTTLRLVAGLERPSAGEIVVAGRTVAGGAWVPPERRRVGLVFQDHALFPHLDVRRNVAFGLHGQEASARRARAEEVLELVHLSHLADRFPHELSGGEQQRVAVARALAPAPAVVLLDEPFSSLDESLRATVRGDITAALRASGTTAVFVTHDQTEALSIGDRVVVLRDGLMEQVGSPEAVFDLPATRFVASFMSAASFLPTHARDGGLACEIGPLPHRHPPQAADPLEVVLRPHEVRLEPAADGPAEVVDAEYHGAFVLHTVRLASGTMLRSWQPSATRHLPGTRVRALLVDGLVPNLVAGDRVVTTG